MIIHRGEIVAERDGLRVMDCKACGFSHLDPLPTPAELATFYQNEFWQHVKNGTRERMDQQREWWSAIYGDWLTLVSDYVPPNSSLLDVGAGYGNFISAAECAGFTASGIDPSADVDHFLIWRGAWQDYQRIDRFECVSALWLIEHLPNPLEFLRWCRDRLGNDGVLLAVVPNDFNAEQAEATEDGKALPNYWVDPTHLNYFTPATFANLLGRAGFRIVERSTLYPMELFLKQGHDYTRNEPLGAVCHALVRQLDLSKDREMRLREYQELASVGLGREIVVVAVKE